MRKILLTAALITAGVVAASNALAAGWALTVDTPLDYTFNSGAASTSTATNSAGSWNHRSTTQVSGSSVLLITPIHIGVGYEDFSVRNAITFPTMAGAATGTADINTNFRIYDLVLDLPMKYLNLTFGYGEGTADTDFLNVTGTGGGVPTPMRNANVNQTFLLAGIPLGKALDLHLGYHWVSVAGKDIITGPNPPFPQTRLSGEMLTAGLRLNF